MAETLDACPGVAEVNVYGVAIAGADGRAGMAAIVPAEGFDLDTLREPHRTRRCRRRRGRSSSASPPNSTRTSTFKQRKLDLVREGFDPSATRDPIYFDDPAAGRLVRVDAALFARLNSGAIRL